MQFLRRFVSLDVEELRDLRHKTAQDYNKLPIRDLCTKRAEKYHIIYFNLDDKFDEMVLKVTELQNSRIFRISWKKYGEKFKSEVVTMEIIFSQMYSKIIEELQLLCQQFHEGEVKLKKIDEYLEMFKMDYDAVVNEFMLLSQHFNSTGQLEQIENKLVDIMEKVKSYKKLFNARQAARAILHVQEVLGLEGDFSQVRNIEKVWLLLC